MSNNTIDKYDILFSTSRDFIERVKACKKGEIEGYDDSEISKFCDKHNITLSPAMWSANRHFGKKAYTRAYDYLLINSLADMEYAIHEANMQETWNGMKTVKEFLNETNLMVNYDYDDLSENEGMYTPQIKSLMNIEDIVFFNYDPYTRSYKFYDSKKENPEIYYLTRYYTLTSLFAPFTDRFRDILFLFISNYAPYDFAEMGIIDGRRVPVSEAPAIDYSGYECIKEYIDIFQNDNIDRSKIRSLRDIFNNIMNNVEKEENRILSFLEYENKFLDFFHDNIKQV